LSKAKVSICVPSLETWKARTAVCHGELSVFSTVMNTAVKTVGHQCSIISMSRNWLVRYSLAFDPPCTHILWIDSDMVFPPNGLERLLAHDKDVVGAFYNKRTPPYTTVGHLLGDGNITGGGIYQADIMPHGFVLVKRSVYERLSPPWYNESYDPELAGEGDPDGTVGEDVNFSRKAIAGGIEMYCDADLTCEMGHLGEIVVRCLSPDGSKNPADPETVEQK